ncbi:hypothetical protein RSAG8_07142, partial [Rhizoctonia solani AG-8 WAC10335]
MFYRGLSIKRRKIAGGIFALWGRNTVGISSMRTGRLRNWVSILPPCSLRTSPVRLPQATPGARTIYTAKSWAGTKQPVSLIHSLLWWDTPMPSTLPTCFLPTRQLTVSHYQFVPPRQHRNTTTEHTTHLPLVS